MFKLISTITRRHTISVGHVLLVTVFVGVSALSAKPLPSPAPAPVQCRTAEACFQHALKLKERVDGTVLPSAQVVASFRDVLAQFPGTIWAHRSRIHLGLLLMESSPAEASTYFIQSKEAFPFLQDYIQFWTAESLLKAHQSHEAATLFKEVGGGKSQSRLKRAALYLTGQALRDSGNCRSAIQWYRRAIKGDSRSPEAASAFLEIGKCQIKLKQVTAARHTFREIWWKFPAEPEAKVAQVILNQQSLATKQEPTLKERYKRALAFFKAGYFEKAVNGLRQYLQHVSKGKNYHEAEYKLSMALARLKRYGEAEKVFQRISVSSSPRRAESVVWLARAYLRQGKGPQLLSMQKSVRSKGLSGDRQSLIHIFAGVWLGDQGKRGQALQAFDKAYKAARSSQKKQDALWRMTWIYYAQDEYDQVLATLKKLLRTSKGDEVHVRAQYWMGRMYEQLQKPKEAQGIFAVIAQDQPLTYYGQLAKGRLNVQVPRLKVGMVSSPFTLSSPSVTESLLRDVHYRKAIELVGLGLVFEAAKELKALTRQTTRKTENLDQIIAMAQKARAFDFGIRLSIRHVGQKLRQDLIPRSAYVWKGAFPTGFISTIQQYAPTGLDPYLVAGLIREESLYDVRATSRVGALGLMQLMPKTATRVAQGLGLALPGKEELFDANTNIQLGTAYVGQLLAEFNGNLVHTVAAYNAGPHVIRRWIAQDPEAEPDEFVERISYRETRGYVKRVLGSYRVYRALASQACQAVSLDRMC
ncbi:MAG: transglycosylase SLT domain-containing protein [Nitrospirales bacterium]